MFAVISDIHANLEAFEAVLEYLDQKQVSKIYCLGDIIGYGPDPGKVIEEHRKRKIISCLGNHDAALMDPMISHSFNPIALQALYWTKKQLSETHYNYLKTLEISYSAENCHFVHSSPASPNAWDYISFPSQSADQFESFSESICFIGHTHYPVVICSDGSSDFSSKIKLNTNKKYLINAGSVGQPRDGDSRACFLLVNDDLNNIEYVRLEYPIEKTQKKIANYKLPEYLATRLAIGR